MKSFYLAIALVAAPAWATPVLDCNLSGGELLQVVVQKSGGAYVVRELDTEGRWYSRTVTSWNPKRFVLRTQERGARYTLSCDSAKDCGFSYSFGLYSIAGEADCR